MTLRDLESLYADLTPARGDAFIQSIREAETDLGALLVMGYLDRIVKEFQPEGRRICAAGEGLSQEDRDALTLHGRILATLILVCHKTNSRRALRESTLLFLEYASAVVRTKYDFLSTALDVLCYRVISPGLDWHIVTKVSSLDLLSYKLMEGIRFNKASGENFIYQGKGRVECRDGRLSVSSSDAIASGAKAFSVCGDRVGVYTRNVRDEKLKGTDQSDAEALRSFAGTFLHVQEEGNRRSGRKTEYRDGERVDIEVTSYERLECEVIDDNAQERGTILNEELVKGLWTEDLTDYIYDYDCIRRAVLFKTEEGTRFSIKDAYMAYARECAEHELRANVCFQARAFHIDGESGKVNWMTPSGYAGITSLDETPGVKVGDLVLLQVKSVIPQTGRLYINLCPPRFNNNEPRPFPAAEEVLEAFLTRRESVEEERRIKAADQPGRERDTIAILSAILAGTAARGSSLDAYRHLLVALFLAGAAGDVEARERLRRKVQYLGHCLSFAQGERVQYPGESDFPQEQKAVLRLLSSWDAPGGEVPAELLEWGADTVPGKAARLLFGMRVGETFQDEVKADRELVRRKICEIVGVGDAFEAEGALRRGKYGMAEGHETEFKSSYVFRNDGRGADLAYQGKCQVFEAVCAFLNADGGVLYLGVNDGGEPIISSEYGLSADMTWLTEHYSQVNASRIALLGHPVPKADSLDHYVLFLNAEKELYFKESLQGNITIEVTEDADAIRLTVAPAEYEIAYLYSDRTRSDGVAYVRDGGRTIPMSRVRKEQRLAELKKVAKEMAFVVTIQEAIDRHQRLIFKDYASGNSGEVKDRYVVPVNLFYNDENVYCFDLDSKTYKQFRLHRIGAVESGEDTSPYTLEVTQAQQADVFRWLLPEGGRPYHVRLRMDIGAKNYLLEEYSCAEMLPPEEFYEETRNKWILDTHVNGLGAVLRFYLGLADKIEILDSEDADLLRESIREYVGKYIKG